MRFTDDARRARLARRHALHPGHRLTSVVDVARALVALHATEPASVHLAVATRMPSATVAAVEDALYEQRTVVKQLAMRRTLFAFPREVLPAVWGSVSARVADAERGRLARDLERHDVADEGAAWIDRGRDAVLGRLAGVFGVSPTQLQSFHAMFPSDKPHRWVPNPVRSFAAAPEAPLARTGVTFVKVGRFAYQKGHDILLRAFARLRTARPEARLVLVGHGPDEAAVRRLIGELGLDDVVSIAHLPADPAPALRNADVYVSASRWEGWSLSICEALRFGLPVVASNCEFGPSDILTDARLGRLVPPLDEAALAEAMQYYCDNLDAERQHAAFRRDYIEKFNVENVVPMHAEALRDIAARR